MNSKVEKPHHPGATRAGRPPGSGRKRSSSAMSHCVDISISQENSARTEREQAPCTTPDIACSQEKIITETLQSSEDEYWSASPSSVLQANFLNDRKYQRLSVLHQNQGQKTMFRSTSQFSAEFSERNSRCVSNDREAARALVLLSGNYQSSNSFEYPEKNK